ncbi:MAG TPA: PAS domain-containing sensor histidine kinase [Bryobacteraceae bacterium]|nr:PAS domain-containing sensor histidine kinase [Bryobacteraceae bacterium]
MVSGRSGERVVTLKGGEPAYRMLVEAMSEGAATLSSDGTVLYSNRKFAEMIRRPLGKVAGMVVPSLIEEKERDRFGALLATVQRGVAKGEFNLRSSDGSLIPVHLSLSRFRGYEGHAVGMVVTDLSEQKRKQAEETRQAETMHRLLLERTFSAQEEERRRIARELHDEAGQLLTSLLVGLRTLEDSRNIADTKAKGQRLRKIAAQAIDEIGRLARGLHPTVLDDHGLGVALSRYVSEYAKTHNITVDLKLNKLDSRDIPPAVQMGLYRILQEALTNVARHSGAKAISIVFARSAAALKVAVTDNGHGFDPKSLAIASSNRLGIQGMRERAAMLGGTVSFTSKATGTRIVVQIPLPGHQEIQPYLPGAKI